MDHKLSVLIIEDSESDAELNARYLQKAGYDIHYRRVETAEEMKRALELQNWDLILSDYSMPHFDVLSALAIYHASGTDIPFIVISGAIGEEKAVELIKAGAHNYLLKNNMTRFASVVNRELSEAQIRNELVNANTALSASEERYHTMINTSPDGIFITHLQGVITEISAVALSLCGTNTSDEMVGINFSTLVPPDEKNNLFGIFEKTLHDGIVQNHEIRFLRKDMSLIVTEASVSLLHDPMGTPNAFMIVIRDVTQRKQLEMKLMHTERMAGLGEMASDIAHEINQPLNTISLGLENLLHELKKSKVIDEPYFRKKASRIFDNISRLDGIISHIRTFSRSNDVCMQSSFNVNDSIKDGVSMMIGQLAGKGIELILKLDDKIPSVIGNTNRFEQVIINLLINAIDALDEKQENADPGSPGIIEIKSYQKAQCVNVDVKDNGSGINPELIDKIMLPFFTTKEAGKGTGLGLSISSGIINEMKGTLKIQSELSRGTILQIVIPVEHNEKEKIHE
jgi:PAS domain S-box-containing protein